MFYSLILSISLADVPRLSSHNADLSSVDKIFLSPGLVTLLEFPQNIIEVRVGNPKSIKALISTVSPKELTLFLSSSMSIPSNLIVRSEKRIFVFDIVPSKTTHQDYYKISGAYGSPSYDPNKQHLISSSPLSPSPNRKADEARNARISADSVNLRGSAPIHPYSVQVGP